MIGLARRRRAYSAVGDASRAARFVAERLPLVLQRSPLHRLHLRCPLPRAEARFGPTLPNARLGPPSRFLTALTASSTDGFVGLLHPTADPRFIGLQPPASCVPAASFKTFPPMPHPPEPSPHQQPTSRHRDTVPPCRSPTCDGRLDFGALLRWGVRCCGVPLPARTARCSPGLPSPGTPHPSP